MVKALFSSKRASINVIKVEWLVCSGHLDSGKSGILMRGCVRGKSLLKASRFGGLLQGKLVQGKLVQGKLGLSLGLAAGRRLQPTAVRRLGGILAALVILGLPSAASAVPIVYNVAGGTVVISVYAGGIQIGSAIAAGLTGQLTIDTAGQSLDAIDITLPSNIALNLSQSYGGYDQVIIESANLSDAVGYNSVLLSSEPASFTTSGGPLDVVGSWSGVDTVNSPPNSPVSGIPIAYQVPTITAVLSDSPILTMNSVTLNSLAGPAFGETTDLVILANITVNSVVAVPEPGTALLVGLGLVLVARIRPSRN